MKRSWAPLPSFSLKGEVLLARLAPPSSSEENEVKLAKRRRAHLFPPNKRAGSLRAHSAKKQNGQHTLARHTFSRLQIPSSVYVRLQLRAAVSAPASPRELQLVRTNG